MQNRREALRRLGGPVCPVCDSVAEIEVRFLSTDGSDWLRRRGKGAVEKQSLAPMCSNCENTMHSEIARKRVDEAERRLAADATAVADQARLSAMSGAEYHEACADHGDDLAAAERMANEWGVGNGLFGSRGE